MTAQYPDNWRPFVDGSESNCTIPDAALYDLRAQSLQRFIALAGFVDEEELPLGEHMDAMRELFTENVTDAENPNLVVVSVEEQDHLAARSKPSDRAGRRNERFQSSAFDAEVAAYRAFGL